MPLKRTPASETRGPPAGPVPSTSTAFDALPAPYCKDLNAACTLFAKQIHGTLNIWPWELVPEYPPAEWNWFLLQRFATLARQANGDNYTVPNSVLRSLVKGIVEARPMEEDCKCLRLECCDLDEAMNSLAKSIEDRNLRSDVEARLGLPLGQMYFLREFVSRYPMFVARGSSRPNSCPLVAFIEAAGQNLPNFQAQLDTQNARLRVKFAEKRDSEQRLAYLTSVINDHQIALQKAQGRSMCLNQQIKDLEHIIADLERMRYFSNYEWLSLGTQIEQYRTELQDRRVQAQKESSATTDAQVELQRAQARNTREVMRRAHIVQNIPKLQGEIGHIKSEIQRYIQLRALADKCKDNAGILHVLSDFLFKSQGSGTELEQSFLRSVWAPMSLV